MLITTCTHCLARFRVTPQQLNVKQGQVRCGRCAEIFNGFEALERFPDDDTGARLLAAREAQAREAGEEPVDLEALPEDDAHPGVDLEVEPSPAGEGQPEAVAPTLPHTRRRRPEPQPVPAGEPGEITLEPPPRTPPSRAWSLGAALLALVLGLELVYALRGPLAQRYPALRPALESVCAHLQCNVPWAREEALLKLEDSELLEVPGKPTEIALGARIRNLASVAQEYPHLELTLTDLTGQAAVRRVLRPTDYLGRPLAPGEVIAPGVDVALHLRLETPRIKATGYELLVFYP